MDVGLTHYLVVAAILFTLGVFGIFLNRKNIILIMMCVELILLSVNINLVAFSAFRADILGQVFALVILTVAAAEAAGNQEAEEGQEDDRLIHGLRSISFSCLSRASC